MTDGQEQLLDDLAWGQVWFVTNRYSLAALDAQCEIRSLRYKLKDFEWDLKSVRVDAEETLAENRGLKAKLERLEQEAAEFDSKNAILAAEVVMLRLADGRHLNAAKAAMLRLDALRKKVEGACRDA